MATGSPEVNMSSLEKYRKWASVHGQYTTQEMGHQKINHAYKKVAEAFGELEKQGQVRQLIGLMEDVDLWVQSWAANHLLTIQEKEALRKLEQLALGSSLVALQAKYRLIELDDQEKRRSTNK